MLDLLFAVLALGIASWQWGIGGFLFAIIICYLLVNQRQLKQKIADLSSNLTSLRHEWPHSIHKQDEESTTTLAPAILPIGKPTEATVSHIQTAPSLNDSLQTTWEQNATKALPGLAYPNNIIYKLITYFTTGNIIAKIGVLLLFFGISFLIKYVAEHSQFPLELRLLSAALLSLLLLIMGWWLRFKRREYALVLQGGGIGLLYIITYAAFRFYGLLPAEFTFLFLFLITLGAIALALLQDTQSLVYLAALGGFLAPLLTATDSHNPVGLFGYYTLLNLMIIVIARYKAWRPLNITGFTFTFVISSLWGYFSYKPDYFLVTETFLFIFFLLYFILSILYTAKQSLNVMGYVDATLVFGLPLVVCTQQAILIAHINYGQAISAIVMALLYAVAATALFRLNKHKFTSLSESFCVLATILATLAIPLTLSGQWTSIVWVIEASGIIWLGIRQQRFWARIFGYLLQGLGQLVFLVNFAQMMTPLALFNFYFLGAIFIALANLISAWLIANQPSSKMEGESSVGGVFFSMGIIWWLVAGLYQIYHFIPNSLSLASSLRWLLGNGKNIPIYSALLFFSLSAAMACYNYKKLAWKWMSYPALGLFPAMLLVSFASAFFAQGFLPWLIAFSVWYWIIKQPAIAERNFLEILHLLTAWFLLWQLAYWFNYNLGQITILSATWSLITWGLIPVVALALLLAKRSYTLWPFAAYQDIFRFNTSLGIIGFLELWLAYSNLSSNGETLPLPYLPLLNPLDIICLLSFSMITKWYLAQRQASARVISEKIFIGILGGLLFFWLNMMLVRSLHYFAHIPFAWNAIFASRIAQTAFSIFWTIIAVGLTFSSSRLKLRTLWFIGLGLIGLVTLKLFFIDLLITSMFLRTLSFCAVGFLLLLIGYFAPLPPSRTVGFKQTD
jgi:uncharacterized membrane protein